MPGFKYRLQPLLEQKTHLMEQAEEELARKQTELRLAVEKLDQFRNSEQALIEKREALRRSVLTSGSGRAVSGAEIGRRREYLQSVGYDVEAAKDAVFAQQLFIDECKDHVTAAQRVLAERSRDVEILKKHREKLEQRFLKEAEKKEARELDEIGNMLYTGKGQRT